MNHLTINLIQGAVSFQFSVTAAEKLKEQINILMQSLKEIALQAKTGGRAKKYQSMEYQHAGEIFLEVFCNPNIYPNPFAAKVLLTVRDERLKLTSEAELTRLIEDLEQYLSAQ